MAETANPEAASTPTSPTTNDELGVLGAQAAKAEQAARARMAPAKADHEQVNASAPDDAHIRTRALELAHSACGFGIITPSEVLATAGTYYAFIKGESNG